MTPTPQNSTPTPTSGGGTEAEYVTVPGALTEAMRWAMSRVLPLHGGALDDAWEAALSASPTDRHGVAGGDAGLREALAKVERLLTNLQPHIEQAAGRRAGLIDNYVDTALETIRAALTPTTPPSPRVSGDREALGTKNMPGDITRERLALCRRYQSEADFPEQRLGFRIEADNIESRLAALASSPPAEMAGVEEVRWRPMDTAPHGKMIVARHKPNKHTPHGWIGTITCDLDDPDEHRRGGLDTILHYNGDVLHHGFHGCWLGWMWPEELAAIRTRQDTRAGGAVEPISVDVQTMRLSGGRADYFVRIKCGERVQTPHVFRQRFKAEYEVAHLQWVFGLRADEPDLMSYSEDSYPNLPATPTGDEVQS